MAFDLLKYHEGNRADAKRHAEELLWENIDGGLWWPPLGTDYETDPDGAKITVLESHWHPVLVEFRTSFGGTILQLEEDGVHEILQYGGGRRLASIHDAVSTISKISFLGREEVLNEKEKRQLDDALMLFFVHVVGFFDSLAIAFHRLFLEDSDTHERSADLLNKKYRKKIGLDELDRILSDHDEWFSRVKDTLRNRYVHRIPPYVAPAALSESEAREFEELDAASWQALTEGRIDESNHLKEKQSSLGKFFPFLTFTEDNENMPILSTVLDDTMRFQFVALSVFEFLVPKLAFKQQA